MLVLWSASLVSAVMGPFQRYVSTPIPFFFLPTLAHPNRALSFDQSLTLLFTLAHSNRALSLD